MYKIYGKEYYLDINALIEVCEIFDNTKNDIDEIDGNGEKINRMEINIFKFETFKTLIERILNGYEGEGENELFPENHIPESIKLSYNTLIKENILKESYD